jgi:four helix bundle protein
MAAYRLSNALLDDAWFDAAKLRRNGLTSAVAAQLYRSASSIAANIAEGYSRGSGRDRVRLFEYALGSARECRVWYQAGQHVLGHEISDRRIAVLDQVCRILLTAIPRERNRAIDRRVKTEEPSE